MASETILVISTEGGTEQEIISTLETQGYLVFAAPGGDSGFEMAKKVKPSLIFASPVEGGLEACKAIHESPSLRSVPIVLLTSYEGSPDPRHTSVYGIVDFLKVPFTAEDLVAKTEDTLIGTFPSGAGGAGPEGADELADTEEVPAAEAGLTQGTAADFPEDDLEEEPMENEPADDFEHEKSSASGDRARGAERPHLRNMMKKEEHSERKRLYFLIAILALALIGAGWFFFGKDYLEKGPRQKIASPPVTTSPVPAIKDEPSQKGGDVSAEKKGAEAPPTPPSAQTAGPAPQAAAAPQAKPSETIPQAAAPEKTADKPAARPSGKKTCAVQIGSFRSDKTAAALEKEFKAKGYEVYTLKTDVKSKGIFYKVLVGKFDNARDCQKMAQTIQAKEKIKTVTYSN